MLIQEKKGVAGERPGEPGEVVVRWHGRKECQRSTRSAQPDICRKNSVGIRERNSATCGLGNWNVPADLDGSRVSACGSDRGELRKWKQLTVEVSPFEKCK